MNEDVEGLLVFKKARPGIMSKFRITELSGVTRGAQAAAKVAFMKRASDTDRDPAPVVDEPDPAIRKAAVLAGVEAIAKATAERSGVSYERAFTDLVMGSRELAEALS